MGFGHGYALAVSDICTVADRWVTVRAERSRFFGVEGAREGWQTVTNLQSDFYWQRLIDSGLVGKELSRPPPVAPIPEVRELVRGYVAGYNYYLQRTGAARIPDPRCRGKPWVRPITERDVYLRAYHTVREAHGPGKNGCISNVGCDGDRDSARWKLPTHCQP